MPEAEEAARKLLYPATMDITRKWTALIRNWALVLNQLVIRFEDRIAIWLGSDRLYTIMDTPYLTSNAHL